MEQQNHHPEHEQPAHADSIAENATEAPASSETEQKAETAATPEETIEALRSEVSEMKDRWLRSEAELQNLRSRSKRDLDDARQYAVQKFARDVVEAAENLQRGLAALPPAQEDESDIIKKMREGLETTERSFLSILERHGINRQDPTGQAFDANLHQAMQEQQSSEHAPGYVIQAWTPAWTLKDRLLKPAMVIVANSSSTGQKPE
ncbi:nucleotide exchange factor GrpE [Aristophania vespae]|uniref:Protein GrpE n=1 Tax=Aristophania vespae TaxID=2697033 RepID=A0A6P1NF71_9PROT|nr:nucleotide exchange factor GrpE [Aristophania vespae]QHI95084.1 nucleotide exchange factor GrpE [Aristophania vespae]